MALSERESHYEAQIKEYQTKRDQSARDMQDLRNELTKLQEEKTTNEKQFSAAREDLEKQIQSFTTQMNELDNQSSSPSLSQHLIASPLL
jgi:uncharacterized coiled-coil DUF342 family protein